LESTTTNDQQAFLSTKTIPGSIKPNGSKELFHVDHKRYEVFNLQLKRLSSKIVIQDCCHIEDCCQRMLSTIALNSGIIYDAWTGKHHVSHPLHHSHLFVVYISSVTLPLCHPNNGSDNHAMKSHWIEQGSLQVCFTSALFFMMKV
jgi:hypothetical protein